MEARDLRVSLSQSWLYGEIELLGPYKGDNPVTFDLQLCLSKDT